MGIKIDRRNFIRTTAAIGAGLYLSSEALGQPAAKKDVINIALLGAGTQGQALMNACIKIGKDSPVRFKAVCDIWENHNLKRVSGTLNLYKAYGHSGTPYTDYREMLDKEKDLDAVIIATPDFWHSEHTVACLKAGLHVYCEKEMSNTLEGARKMVEAARETGKLLQIGHQRRSNPRYIYCYEKVVQEMKLLGRLTNVNGQWNRSKGACEDVACPDGTEMDEAVLNKYGFKSMKQFMNWRWYKGLGGGPIVDLGSHQIDIYNWFLNAAPRAVTASGGTDYWKEHEWYDNVMAVFEYETKSGIVRAFYQTLTTNSSNGYYEHFMGDEGTLVISEAPSRGNVYREGWLAENAWDEWVKKGHITASKKIVQPENDKNKDATALDIRPPSPEPAKFDLPLTMDMLTKPFHQAHLENFFDAIRGNAKLTCPAEMGYETAVTVLKVNQAVEAAKRLEFKPEEFKI